MNKFLNVLLMSGTFSAAVCPAMKAAEKPAPPNPPPLFKKAGSIRTIPELLLFEVTKDKKIQHQPNFVMGQKRVLQLKNLGNSVFENTEYQISVRTPASGATIRWHGPGRGWPFLFLTPEEMKQFGVREKYIYEIDKESKTITYRRPYITHRKKLSCFTYTLKPAGAGQMEIIWNSGDDAVLPSIFVPSSYRGKTIKIGERIFTETPEAQLLRNKGKTVNTRLEKAGDFSLGGVFDGFSVKGLDTRKAFVSEHAWDMLKGNTQYSFGYYMHESRSGRMLIDLGESVDIKQSAGSFPAVNGLDFSKGNGIHFPLPPTRNELRNPSFEMGLRYWTFQPGKNTPDQNAYRLINDGLFGKKALLLRSGKDQRTHMHSRPSALFSMPQQLLADQTYTLSWYAKSQKKPGMMFVGIGSNSRLVSKPSNPSSGDSDTAKARFRVPMEWTRFSRTFQAGSGGFKCWIGALGSDIVIDGMQLERGDKASDFVTAPVEPLLLTSDPDNDIRFGTPVNAALRLTGKAGTKADVKVTVSNFFNEKIHTETISAVIGKSGFVENTLSNAFESFGKGIFIVRFTIRTAGVPEYDVYTRYSVMTPLNNTNPTSMLTGTLVRPDRVGRPDDMARKLMEWGFGSSSWMVPSPKNDPDLNFRLFRKYRIKNVHYAVCDQVVRFKGFLNESVFQDRIEIMKKIYQYRLPVLRFSEKTINAKQEKAIEEAVYQYLKDKDPESALAVSWENEEEGSVLPAAGKYKEYFKFQRAAVAGAKRANPAFKSSYSSGVSSIQPYKVAYIDNYLKAAHEGGIKYDVLTFHAYGHIDGGRLGSYDLDKQVSEVLKVASKYGYGKETPVYITELANEMLLNIPEWYSLNGDTYQWGLPEYSWGHYEMLNAASMLRIWCSMLKYWPQVQHTNIWQSRPYMDYYLTPLFVCKAVNTFGNLFPWAKFVGDIRPAPHIRGYAYELKDGSGIAAVWSTKRSVDTSEEENPVAYVRFSQPVKFIDMMENERFVKPDKDGVFKLAVISAPLFIKARDPLRLMKDLQSVRIQSFDREISLVIAPDIAGKLKLTLKNLVSNQVKGTALVGDQTFKFDLEPMGHQVFELGGSSGAEIGKMYRSNCKYQIRTMRESYEGEWQMSYFFVPEVKNGKPDWNRIPAYPIANLDRVNIRAEHPDHYAPGDFSAKYQIAWDKDNLYLRITAKDDKVLVNEELKDSIAKKRWLWQCDGCLEFYLDTLCSGRAASDIRYDDDDLRYDFAMNPNKVDGPCLVWPHRLPDKQVVDGLDSPSEEEIAEKVKADFRKTSDGYIYTVTLKQRYVKPFFLKSGSPAGVAFYLHDHDTMDKTKMWRPPFYKSFSSGLEKGKHCQDRPAYWPIMILK